MRPSSPLSSVPVSGNGWKTRLGQLVRTLRAGGRSVREHIRPRHYVWAGLLLVTLVALLLWALNTGFTWAHLREAIERLNPWALFLVLALLPVFGGPIILVYLAAGARFGPWGGGAMVAAATAVHLVATHLIARGVFRNRLERFLARHAQHLPKLSLDRERALAAVVALMPGLPYLARNAFLALSGIPLRVYFVICLPIYVVRSYVTIFLGDLGARPRFSHLALLGAVYVVKLTLCALLIRHLLRAKPHPAPLTAGVQ